MRAPAAILAVDAAILVAAVFGKSTGVIVQAAMVASLITTDRAVEEARRRIEFGMKRPDLLPLLEALASDLAVMPLNAMAPILARCENVLREAVPSRNGSARDAHLLALAWSYDADIWSPDRDFAGTGVASWSNANLLRAFARTGHESV